MGGGHLQCLGRRNTQQEAYQSCPTGLAAYRGGHRAHGAERRGRRAARQAGGCGRHHPPHGSGLGFGWCGGREANLGHFVDRSKQAIFGLTLKIPLGDNNRNSNKKQVNYKKYNYNQKALLTRNS